MQDSMFWWMLEAETANEQDDGSITHLLSPHINMKDVVKLGEKIELNF